MLRSSGRKAVLAALPVSTVLMIFILALMRVSLLSRWLLSSAFLVSFLTKCFTSDVKRVCYSVMLLYDNIYPSQLSCVGRDGREISLDVCGQDSHEVQLTFPPGVVRRLFFLPWNCQYPTVTASDSRPPSLLPLHLRARPGQTDRPALHHLPSCVQPAGEDG